MVRFTARTDLGVFDFNKIADVHFAMHHGTGAQTGERADSAILRHDGVVEHAVGKDLGALANLRVGDNAIGPKLHPSCQLYFADQDGVHVNENIAAHLNIAANVD